MKHMVVNLVQDLKKILLHMLSHDILCAGSNKKKIIEYDTESERGGETGVVLTDTVCLGIIRIRELSHAIKYNILLL